MTRSLPEKTFEHWCAIHLTYRYRAKLRMWWPSAGADIEVDGQRLLAGKRYWLELKCPEWEPSKAGGKHVLEIDLQQLHAYGGQGVPDYYLFPKPPWDGVLGDADSAAWLAGRHRSDFGYQSHSGDDWFAEWSWIVSGDRLRRAMRQQIADFLSGKRKEQARVLTYSGTTLTWARGVAGLKPLRWKEFLRTMEKCGGPDMPAQFVLPPGSVRRPHGGVRARSGPPDSGASRAMAVREAGDFGITHAALKGKMEKLEDPGDAVLDRPQVFSPAGEGGYEATPLSRATSTEGFVWGVDERRALISMTRSALDLTS
jgi:hypothetical protein